MVAAGIPSFFRHGRFTVFARNSNCDSRFEKPVLHGTIWYGTVPRIRSMVPSVSAAYDLAFSRDGTVLDFHVRVETIGDVNIP